MYYYYVRLYYCCVRLYYACIHAAIGVETVDALSVCYCTNVGRRNNEKRLHIYFDDVKSAVRYTPLLLTTGDEGSGVWTPVL